MCCRDGPKVVAISKRPYTYSHVGVHAGRNIQDDKYHQT